VKSWITKFWLSGAEVAGNPRLIGRLPDQAASADVADALYQALNDLSADGVGVLKGESNIEVLRVEAQGSGSVWETLIKRCDAAISKAVLGSTINVEVGEGGGNRALAESQGDITITPRLQRSARLVCNTIERDLFQPFLEFNRHRYGGMTPVPSLSLILYEAQAEIDQLAVASGVVKVDELRQSRGLEPLGEANGGGAFIAAPAPAAPAFAAGIAGGLGSQASQTEYRAVTVEADAELPLRDAAWTRALRAAHRAGLAHAATSGR